VLLHAITHPVNNSRSSVTTFRFVTFSRLALVACAASALTSVHAAEEADSSLVLSLGAERSTSSLSGAATDKPTWSPSFGVDYTHGRFFASTERGLGYEFLKTDTFTAFGALGFSPGREAGKAKDSPRLVGMGKVKAAGLLVLGADYAPFGDLLHLNAVTLAATDRDQGYSARLGATVGFPVWGDISGFVDAGVTYGDRKHAQTFYGVTPAQAASSGNPAYTPKAGWTGAELAVGLSWSINKQWSADASVGRTQLRGIAASSPLFTRRNQPTASVSVSYAF
jgi:MipA family protein